jgi:transposase
MHATVRSQGSVKESVLFVAFELAKRQWKLALSSGFGVTAMVRTVSAGDWAAVEAALAAARRRFALAATVPVVSCYEAGRDGFWIHRALAARGIANRVVDSSSIDVKRRARRMKTDRIDAINWCRCWCGCGPAKRGCGAKCGCRRWRPKRRGMSVGSGPR